MIRTVRIRGFKRFEEVEFRLPDHVVLAGPNNTGKTTVLQAIASWSLALRRWREINDFNLRRGYTWAPIARQAFGAVPLRSFDLLWTDRRYGDLIEIELRHSSDWSVTMELQASTTEQIFVRPNAQVSSETLRALDLRTVFVPPMTGLGTEEPLFQPPKIEQLLGLGRPGEVLRNLLAEANRDERAWSALKTSIGKLFGYELLPPDASGAHILAEYTMADGGSRLDIASAGSGFQQVLMLLAFLNTRQGAVLLLDEPDAHLHVILQDAIYHEAADRSRPAAIATHRRDPLRSGHQRRRAPRAVRHARQAPDGRRQRGAQPARFLAARVEQCGRHAGNGGARHPLRRGLHGRQHPARLAATLEHRAAGLLDTDLMWKPIVFQAQEGRPGIRARDHFEALQLVREGLPGLELLDGDAHRNIPDTDIIGAGLQRLRWRRYEIESYLVHPDVIARFIKAVVGAGSAEAHVEDMLSYWRDELPPAVVRDPLGDHEFLNVTKARTRLLPPLLEAAGLHGLPYTRYHEIAALMLPDEVHPEVTEKLDAICRAFGTEP